MQKFLSKLGSLAPLALSTSVQKREYLRRFKAQPSASLAEKRPRVTNGFLLDRARLLVAPVGLDSVVRSFVEKGIERRVGAALDFGRQIVHRLHNVLSQDGRNVHLDTCLDGPFSFHLADLAELFDDGPALDNVAGLTAWEATAALKSQLRSAGVLHGVAEHGTLAIFSCRRTKPLRRNRSPTGCIRPGSKPTWCVCAWFVEQLRRGSRRSRRSLCRSREHLLLRGTKATNPLRELRKKHDECVGVRRFIVGEIEPRRHGRAHEGESAAGPKHASLPNAGRNDRLHLLSRQNVGTERDDTATVFGSGAELQHLHGIAQVEMKVSSVGNRCRAEKASGVSR